MKSETVTCNDNGTRLESELWKPGVPVSIMWMPAGVHSICAGFRNGSIELTVKCDKSTAEAVQASLESWRSERPRQECFGCIEHQEREASFRVSASCGFQWSDDGVYLTAEPTTLGAQNVNGKVHRSWSPSFTTDADYSQAKTVKTSIGTVLVFPEGVRGSRSNPAEITGVDFCVGTLTNKPAFHAMSPVKSSEGETVTAAGTSEGAKKGWTVRMHSNSSGKGTWTNLHLEHAESKEDAEKQAVEKGKGSAYPYVGEARPSYRQKNNFNVKRADGKTVSVYIPGNEARSSDESYDQDSIQATWSDAARQAAAEARKRSSAAKEEPIKRSMDGNPRADHEAYELTKAAHRASLKTTEETGKGGYDQDSHNYAQSQHLYAAAAHKKAGDSFMSELHTKAAAAHREATSELWKENNKASSSTQGNQVHAHCAHILLQDVPDATAAEIACYDKCIDEGGSHITAVTEIKAQRKPEHVTQKAGDELTPDSIYATLEQRLEAANSVAKSRGVISVEDVYDKVTASGTSEGAKKGWESRPDWGYPKMLDKFHHPSFGDLTYKGHVGDRANTSDAMFEDSKGERVILEMTNKDLNKYKASDQDIALESIYATWSDAARQAAAASRKAHKMGQAQISADYKGDVDKAGNAKVAIAHLDAAEHFWAEDDQHPSGKEHSEKASYHMKRAGFSSKEVRDSESMDSGQVKHMIASRFKLKASEEPLTLESIYARAGANR